MLDLSCFKRGLSRLIARHAETVRLQRELDGSSDRALAELGLARGDIAAVAHGQFGRP